MTKLRIVHRAWLARPYVIEEAPCVGIYETREGDQHQFGAFTTLHTCATEADAREYVKLCQNERVVEEVILG